MIKYQNYQRNHKWCSRASSRSFQCVLGDTNSLSPISNSLCFFRGRLLGTPFPEGFLEVLYDRTNDSSGTIGVLCENIPVLEFWYE